MPHHLPCHDHYLILHAHTPRNALHAHTRCRALQLGFKQEQDRFAHAHALARGRRAARYTFTACHLPLQHLLPYLPAKPSAFATYRPFLPGMADAAPRLPLTHLRATWPLAYSRFCAGSYSASRVPRTAPGAPLPSGLPSLHIPTPTTAPLVGCACAIPVKFYLPRCCPVAHCDAPLCRTPRTVMPRSSLPRRIDVVPVEYSALPRAEKNYPPVYRHLHTRARSSTTSTRNAAPTLPTACSVADRRNT